MTMQQITRREGYDVVIAGSGPTACVLAKDLSSRGKTVIVLEEGDDSRKYMGGIMAMLSGKHVKNNLPKHMFYPTEEGDDVLIGVGLGGGTKTYSGAAFMPNFELFRKYDIDLEPFIRDAKAESWVSPRPDAFIGPGCRNIIEASHRIGLPLQITEGHVRWEMCKKGCPCCTYGCKAGAKWEGKYAAEEAMLQGTSFLFNTKAENVIIEHGKAVGFQARNLKTRQDIEIRGKVVVVSCGGLGSVALAKKAGMREAGSWFTGDPMSCMYGFIKQGRPGTMKEHIFSATHMDHENDLCYAASGLPFGQWFGQHFIQKGPRAFKDMLKYDRTVYAFFKIHDQDQGWVDENGKMSKSYTEQDKERLDYGWEMLRKLLVESGCDPKTIHRQTIVLGHPSGTVKVGPCLDRNLQSKTVPNLYFCDASTFPESIGTPPVLTLICLSKYFTNHLLSHVL